MINIFQHTLICNCLYLFPSRPVTGMTGCAALPHNENEWHGVKNGRLFERSEFRPFSHDRHSQRNGSSGRPPFSSSILFRRLEKEWIYEGIRESSRYAVCTEKYIAYVNDTFTRNMKIIQKEPLHDGAVLFVYRFYYLLPKRND